MISDNNLYNLAIALGSLSMLLIVLHHFLEVNAKEDVAMPGPAMGAGEGGKKVVNPVLSEERKADSVPAGPVGAGVK